MDDERRTLSVSNSSAHQSNALINVLSNWNQVMEQSYPVQPAQGLISAEAQWINGSISMHVCVCMFVYVWKLPTSLIKIRMFLRLLAWDCF